MGARYYDAAVGRFTTRDTYLDQKPYTYCEGDPINGVDPSGHMTLTGDYLNAVLGGAALILAGAGAVVAGIAIEAV